MAYWILAGGVVVAAFVGLLIGSEQSTYRGNERSRGLAIFVACLFVGAVVVAAFVATSAAQVLR